MDDINDKRLHRRRGFQQLSLPANISQSTIDRRNKSLQQVAITN